MRSCTIKLNQSKLNFNNALSNHVLQHGKLSSESYERNKKKLICCDILNALCGRGKIINYFETSSFLKIVLLWILLPGSVFICNILVFTVSFVIKIIAGNICV